MTNPFGAEAEAGHYSTDKENQLQSEDSLVERGLDDSLDEGYSPPERAYGRGGHESLDQILADEEPDPASRINVLFDEDEQRRSDASERDAEFPPRREVGGARAGRLVAPDWGFGEDDEAELLAADVGISGGAASAEEAAVHLIEDSESEFDDDETR